MKNGELVSGNTNLSYKILSKFRKDSILFICGLIAYFISAFLSGIVFNVSLKYYFFYVIGVNIIPIMLFNFAKTFTSDKSNSKLTIFGLLWGIVGYIGTITGEYFMTIASVMPAAGNGYSAYDLFIKIKSNVDILLKQYTGFDGLIGEALYKFIYINHEKSMHLFRLGSYDIYVPIYLEISRIFTIVVGTILISNYLLSSKRYINFIGKNKSLKKENCDYNSYNEGMMFTELPLSIKPNAWIFVITILILCVCTTFVVWITPGENKITTIYSIISIFVILIFVILIILEFCKIKFDTYEMSWRENSNIKNIKLEYKKITKVDFQTDLKTTIQTQGMVYNWILLYSKDRQKPYKIQAKYLSPYKISKIVRIISEKAPDVVLRPIAELLKDQKMRTYKIHANWLVTTIIYFFTINIIITIILIFGI